MKAVMLAGGFGTRLKDTKLLVLRKKAGDGSRVAFLCYRPR